MAYDVFRRPGAWVSRRRDGHRRRLGAILFIVVLAMGVALLATRLDSPASMIVSGAVLVAVLGARGLFERHLDLESRFAKGAAGESAVGSDLEQLRYEGFIVMHDLEGLGGGNVDHLVSGPSGVFMVETKWRRYALGDLATARRRAARVHDELRVYVTPVICLATRTDWPAKRDGVWVVGRPHLLDWMRGQENRTVEFDRLARFADGL